MASNTSQRKAQAIILASPVEAFRTWFLIVGCEPCGPRAVRISGFPVDLTICQVIMRLRCHVCGGKAVTGSDSV